MKKNAGIADRLIRFISALVLFDLASTNSVTGGWNILIWVLAGIFLVTAIVGRCPLYSLFGINTCRNKKAAQ